MYDTHLAKNNTRHTIGQFIKFTANLCFTELKKISLNTKSSRRKAEIVFFHHYSANHQLRLLVINKKDYADLLLKTNKKIIESIS